MKIFAGSRRSGKTTRLIIESANTGAVIVVATYQRVQHIKRIVKNMGLEIPEPITFDKYMQSKQKHVLIDDIESVLNRLLPSNVDGFTLSVGDGRVEVLPTSDYQKEYESMVEGRVDLQYVKKPVYELV